MSPFVDFGIDMEWIASLRTLRDDNAGAALIQFGNDPVGIKRLVGDQSSKLDTFDQWGNAHRVVTLAR